MEWGFFYSSTPKKKAFHRNGKPPYKSQGNNSLSGRLRGSAPRIHSQIKATVRLRYPTPKAFYSHKRATNNHQSAITKNK